jgi:putative ABC transport system permease protein
MSRLAGLAYALRSIFGRTHADRDTADEMEFHVARETQRLVERGVPVEEAKRRALGAFGGVTRWREETADERPGAFLHGLWREIALAARALVRRPAFTIPALLTLALGIGANTAVFSVVRDVVLRPLPYREPERLAAIWPTSSISNAELVFLQERATSFEAVAAFSPGWGYSMTGAGEPRQVDVARTSTNFFRTLGVSPLLGRAFVDAESGRGEATAVMLSHRIWMDHFAGAPSAIGRVVTMNGIPHRIVGVMPASFEAFQPGVEAWIPLEVDPSSPFHRGQVSIAFGRLRPGVSLDQAQSELATMIPQLRALLEAPSAYGTGYTVAALRDVIGSNSRDSLFVLFGAAWFIVLIAGANYGNLLLLRASSRRREVAVRAALGASRARIARQFLIESVVLSAVGGVIGFAIGVVGVRALRTLLPADLPRLASVSVDVSLLLTCTGLAVAIGLVFGVAPALLASRGAQHDALREAGGVTRESGGSRMRGALVVVEFASALVLLVGAGLMLQTVWRMQRVDPGFSPSQVLTFRLQPAGARVNATADPALYYDELLGRIAALPGIERVGSSQHLPLTGFNWGADIAIEGTPTPPGATPPRTTWRTISGDYFGAMRIPLRRGRAFSADDRAGSPPVVIINETMARRFWPREDPVGKRLRLGRATMHEWATVVGVVGDVRFRGLTAVADNEVYRPLAQQWQSSAFVVARTAGDPRTAMAPIRAVIRSYDATVPISAVHPMDAIVAASFARANMVMMLLLAFAAVGVMLGAVGIYGIISYDVSQRTRELGIRAALGAASHSLAGLVLRRAATLALIGIAVGSIVALATARALESLVFGVQVRDPMTYVALSVFLVAVALLAAHLPARRAVRVDPILALRSD